MIENINRHISRPLHNTGCSSTPYMIPPSTVLPYALNLSTAAVVHQQQYIPVPADSICIYTTQQIPGKIHNINRHTSRQKPIIPRSIAVCTAVLHLPTAAAAIQQYE